LAEQVVKLRLDTSGFDRALRGATAALAGLVSVGTLRSIVNVTSTFEDLQDTLVSVTGSARAGERAFKGIQSFATRTQFSVEELSQVFIKLQGAGITPTEKLLTSFTDAAAVTTDQIGTLTAISDLFSRTVEGGLNLEDLIRLGDRGIPVFRILKEELNLSRDEITEFGRSAEGAATITQALLDGIDKYAGGATQQKLDNLSTLQSNFGIQLRNTANTIGTALAPALKEVIRDFTLFLEQNDQLAAQFGRGLGKAIRVTADALKLLADNFQLVTAAVASVVYIEALRRINFIISDIRKGAFSLASVTPRIAAFFASVQAGLAGVAAFALANPFTAIALAVGALISMLIGGNGLGRTLAQVNAGFEYLGISLTGIKDFIVGGFTRALDRIKRDLASLRQFFVDLVNSLAEYIPGIDGISSVTSNVVDQVKEDFGGMATAVGGFIDHVKDAGTAYDIMASQIAEAEPDVGLPTAANDNGTGTTAPLGPTAEELDKQKEALDQKFLNLTQSLYTEQEAESIAYQNRLRVLEDYYMQSNMTQARYNEIKERIETAHSKKMADIAKANYDNQLNLFKSGKFAELDFTKFSEKEKAKFVIEGGREALDALGQQNKEAFQLAKAAALAEAVINTAQGVTKALAQGGIFGPLLAGVIIAAGAAQIATIASQQYTGRQFGGPVTKGKPYLVGEAGAEMFVPSGSGQIVPNRGLDDSNVVNINFNIQAVDAQGLDQVILQRKGLITNIVREGMENQGRRSVV